MSSIVTVTDRLVSKQQGLEHPLVSVIIPVYNDSQRLQKCVAAVCRQRYPAHRIEIVVVDNGSTNPSTVPDTGEIRLVLIMERTPGSYAARNAGLRVASGDVVAFTDSDCVPHPDWIQNGITALSIRPDVGVVAGAIHVVSQADRIETAAEAYDVVMAFRQSRVSNPSYAVTANWFSWRQVIASAGAFDETRMSGGDHKLSTTLAKQGYRIESAPDAVVYHPARTTYSSHVVKARRRMGAQVVQAASCIPRLVRLVSTTIVSSMLTSWRLLWLPGHLYRRSALVGVSLGLLSVKIFEFFRVIVGGRPERR